MNGSIRGDNNGRSGGIRAITFYTGKAFRFSWKDCKLRNIIQEKFHVFDSCPSCKF